MNPRLSSVPPPFVRAPSSRSVPPPPASSGIARLAIRLGLCLLVVFLAGRCSLAVTDRPRFLGLATATGGNSLKDATRVVIVLHGYGADKDDLARLAPEVLELGAPEHTAFLFAEGPYRAAFGRAWWRTTDPKERADSVSRVNELVDDVLAKTGLLADHVYIAGFSQGAALALEVALSRTDTLGGVAAFSPCAGSTDWAALAASHAPVRGVVAHGKDDRVCPISGGTAISEQLARAGHAVQLVSFEGPHRISREGETALAAMLRGE